MNIIKLFSRVPMSIEDWSKRNSTLSSPDMLIAAAVAESIAKEFQDWKPNDLCQRSSFYSRGEIRLDPCLVNSKKDIKVSFGKREWTTRELEPGYSSLKRTRYHVDWSSLGTTINGIPIGRSEARLIVLAWEKTAKQVKRTQEAAERAKQDMACNEAKWNLAEKLLGMKRNEQGALVPVKTVEPEVQAQAIEEECDCDLGEVCRVCG